MTAFLSDILAIVEAVAWDDQPNKTKLRLATFGGVYDANPVTQSVATQSSSPSGIFFKPDGTKMYEVSDGDDLIYEFDLSVPWDLSTRVLVQSVASQDSAPKSIFFKPDGMKMYEIGWGNLIYESDLSVAWDISTRVFLQSIATQGNFSQGLFFKPDGTKMYESSRGGDLIYESDLSTPWDISTAVFNQSVASQATNPNSIFIKPDGSKLYEIDDSTDLIYESDLSTPWDISTAVFNQAIPAQDSSPQSVFFKPDGTKMYESGDTANLIYESNLSTPWDISSTLFLKKISSQDSSPVSIFFKPDGTKMYESGDTANLIYESNLSTPWDIDTAVFFQSIARQNANSSTIFISPDGLKLYEAGNNPDLIYESDLSVAWDISTAVLLQSVAAQANITFGLFFNPDGTKMYEVGFAPDLIYESDLSTPWDISTRVFNQSIATQASAPYGIFFKPDGTKMYEGSTFTDLIYESNLSTPWDISTRVLSQSAKLQDTEPRGFFFKPDGTKLYEAGDTFNSIYERDIYTPWNITSDKTHYSGRLTNNAIFESQINVVFWGQQTVNPDFGYIDIGIADQNADIIDFAQKVTIADVSFYRVRNDGTIRQLALARTSDIAFADEDTIRLRLESRLANIFNLPVNQYFYDDSIPDLEGKPYPILWGPGADSDIDEARQMAPCIQVSTGSLPEYHFTDLDVIDLSDPDQAPMDRGVALGPSQFSITDNGFTLDANAEGKVTFFQPTDGGVEDPNDNARLEGVFRFIRLAAQRLGIYDYLFIPNLLELDELFSADEFPQFQTMNVVRLRDFMSQIFDSFAGYFYVDFNGIINYGQLLSPDKETSVYDFTDSNTTGPIQLNADTAPNLSDRIEYSQNWGALSEADLATSLEDSEFKRARILKEYEKKISATPIDFYESARAQDPLKWSGRYTSTGALPLAELNRWWNDLYFKRRWFYTFQANLTEENSTLALGDVISIQSDRFGMLNDPVNLVIQSLRFDFGQEILTITGWGGGITITEFFLLEDDGFFLLEDDGFFLIRG